MNASSYSPSSSDLFAGPMVQLSRESEVITPCATDKWVPRIKRGMTGLEEVNA
jgi:hypothetical protein